MLVKHMIRELMKCDPAAEVEVSILVKEKKEHNITGSQCSSSLEDINVSNVNIPKNENKEYYLNPINIIKQDWKGDKFPFSVIIHYKNGEIVTLMESILTGRFEPIKKAMIDNQMNCSQCHMIMGEVRLHLTYHPHIIFCSHKCLEDFENMRKK